MGTAKCGLCLQVVSINRLNIIENGLIGDKIGGLCVQVLQKWSLFAGGLLHRFDCMYSTDCAFDSWDCIIYIHFSNAVCVIVTFVFTFQNVVANLTRDNLNSLVLKLIDREPGLVFDLCIPEEGTHQPPCGSSAPSWCKCGNCQTMPSILESKCCGCLPQNCISTRDVCFIFYLSEQIGVP